MHILLTLPITSMLISPGTKLHALNYLYKVYAKPFPLKKEKRKKKVSTKEICEIIKSLKWKNLPGYDEIPVSILQLSLPCIISPLTHICNKSVSTGKFPS